jgi:hypothetical protein
MATTRRSNTVALRARSPAQLQSRDVRDTVREPLLRADAARPSVTRETTAEMVRRARAVPNAPSAIADARTKYLVLRAAIDEESAPELKRALIRRAFTLAQLAKIEREAAEAAGSAAPRSRPTA